MEPIVIVTAVIVLCYVYRAVIDTLKDLRREKHTYVIGLPAPVKVRCRDHAYNDTLLRNRDRW